jgi:hypothetical protein
LSAEQDDIFVDPSSVTVVLHAGELAIIPVDCDPKEWCEAAEKVLGLTAHPLPDGRVIVKRV